MSVTLFKNLIATFALWLTDSWARNIGGGRSLGVGSLTWIRPDRSSGFITGFRGPEWCFVAGV